MRWLSFSCMSISGRERFGGCDDWCGRDCLCVLCWRVLCVAAARLWCVCVVMTASTSDLSATGASSRHAVLAAKYTGRKQTAAQSAIIKRALVTNRSHLTPDRCAIPRQKQWKTFSAACAHSDRMLDLYRMSIDTLCLYVTLHTKGRQTRSINICIPHPAAPASSNSSLALHVVSLLLLCCELCFPLLHCPVQHILQQLLPLRIPAHTNTAVQGEEM